MRIETERDPGLRKTSLIFSHKFMSGAGRIDFNILFEPDLMEGLKNIDMDKVSELFKDYPTKEQIVDAMHRYFNGEEITDDRDYI